MTVIQDLKFGIVGLGRLGGTLFYHLYEKINIVMIYDKSKVKIDNFFKEGNLKNIKFDLNAVEKIDVLLVTVNDDSIKEVVELIKNIDLSKKVRYAIHFSGSKSSKELQGLEKIGFYIGSLHPLMTFKTIEKDESILKELYWGYEGSNECYEIANFLVNLFDGKIIKIPEKYKSLYHLSATLVSNYIITLYFQAVNILKKIGISEKEAKKMLNKLFYQCCNNIINKGVEQSLTGPLKRGDLITISKHFNGIKSYYPEFEKFYKELIRFTLPLVERDIAKKVEKLLEGFKDNKED